MIELIGILRRHRIDYVRQGDQLFALDSCTHKASSGKVTGRDTWLDITGWSKTTLYHWLGY